MSAFSPEFSKIFKIAAFANLYSSVPAVIVRLGLVLILGFLTFYSFNLGEKTVYLWLSLLGLDLMFEVFYREKVLASKPLRRIGEGSENIADNVEPTLAKILLRTKDWSKASAIFKTSRSDQKVNSFLVKLGLTQDDITSLEKASERGAVDLHKILLRAKDFATKEKREYIDQLDLLLALFEETAALKQWAETNNLREEGLLNIVYWVRHLFEKGERRFWERMTSSFGLGLASLWEGGWTLETEKYTKNISEALLKGQIKSHLVGRQKIILRTEEMLSRSTKRNAILVGEPGVGKTTVVYGLAEKSAHGQVPESLKYKKFLELDLASLLSEAVFGVLEERISNLLAEISHADVVLFIPEIENLTTKEAGGVDITGLISETLQGAGLQVIGTTTRPSYKKYIEPKGAFAESFEVIEIPEPSNAESIRILEEAAANIELKNKIVITYKAIEQAVDLSKSYLVDKVLPGKAIDLLDEGAAAQAIRGERLLKPELIEEIVSQKTKAPVSLAKGAETEKLLNLEDELHTRVIDQEDAIKSVSEALRRARALRRESSRAIGVFLFLGPTGVGKTETAKALASLYFGSVEKMVRIDMSEFQGEESLARLIGSNEQSGQLTEAVRANPFTVVLLDEIEKASQKVQEALLPVFDEGKLTDSSGRQILFTNTIIIATSNAEAEFIRESILNDKSIPDIKKTLLENLQRLGIFKPEFLNRFDDIVVYKPLSQDEVRQIAGLLTNDLTKRMEKQDIGLSVDEEALTWLAENGYDPTYGARPLRRLIEKEIEAPLAKEILSGKVKQNQKVLVGVREGKLTFSQGA